MRFFINQTLETYGMFHLSFSLWMIVVECNIGLGAEILKFPLINLPSWRDFISCSLLVNCHSQPIRWGNCFSTTNDSDPNNRVQEIKYKVFFHFYCWRKHNISGEKFFSVCCVRVGKINQILTWLSPNKNSPIKRSDSKIYTGWKLMTAELVGDTDLIF